MYWNYSCLTISGKVINNSFKGSKPDACKMLKEEGATIISISPDYPKSVSQAFRRTKLSNKILGTFFFDFNELYSAGISINEIFKILSDTSKNVLLKETITALQYDVKKGFSLTESINNTNAFPWVVPCVIQAGEKGGCLESVFQTLGKYYERKDKVRSLVLGASCYPSFVLLLLLGLTIFVSTSVIPQLETLLPKAASNNLATNGILGLSHLLCNYWWVFVGFLGVIILYLNFLRIKFQGKFNQLIYKLPVFGNIVKNAAISLYFLNLSLLVKSGIPLLEAFNSLEKISSNTYVTTQFLACRDYIVGGSTFWRALDNIEFFPPIASFSIRKGEESGNIDSALTKLTSYFENDVLRKTNFALSLIQPTMILFCGGFLIILATAFLVPIYGNLSTIAGGNF